MGELSGRQFGELAAVLFHAQRVVEVPRVHARRVNRSRGRVHHLFGTYGIGGAVMAEKGATQLAAGEATVSADHAPAAMRDAFAALVAAVTTGVSAIVVHGGYSLVPVTCS